MYAMLRWPLAGKRKLGNAELGFGGRHLSYAEYLTRPSRVINKFSGFRSR
jgi:hypothetical protein